MPKVKADSVPTNSATITTTSSTGNNPAPVRKACLVEMANGEKVDVTQKHAKAPATAKTPDILKNAFYWNFFCWDVEETEELDPSSKKAETLKKPITVVYCNLCGQKLRIKSRNYSGLERHLFNSNHRDMYVMAKEQHGIPSSDQHNTNATAAKIPNKRAAAKRGANQQQNSSNSNKKKKEPSVSKDQFDSMVSKLESIKSLGELLQASIEKSSDADTTQKGLAKCIVDKSSSSTTPGNYSAMVTTATCIRSFVLPLQDLIASSGSSDGKSSSSKSQTALLKSILELVDTMVDPQQQQQQETVGGSPPSPKKGTVVAL